MRTTVFGMLLVVLLSLVVWNQRPERAVRLDTSNDSLFLGKANPCGSDSVAGWTDCDPQTNNKQNRVQNNNTPGLRLKGKPKTSSSRVSTKDGGASIEPADLEIGDSLPDEKQKEDEFESTSDDAFVPAFW